MPLHPDFPVVEGTYQMTREWSVVLPSKFNRRVEDGSLVLWRLGLTAWVTVWSNNKGETRQERLAWVKDAQSPQAESVRESERGSVLYYAYRLAEGADDDRVPALYGFAFGNDSHVQMAVYFDREQDLADAQAMCSSLTDGRG